ncbi:MAG TPA: hypothetical protein VL947_08160, partial [Cytophagales bacterium]|nr:hypothetical protein [Cytophagales bacterium]
RVEVVKGPSSTLYGSEAVAGVINIITKDPEHTERLSTDFSVTSLGEMNFDVSTKYKLRQSHAMLGLNYFNYSVPKDINNDGFTDVTLQNRVSVFNKYAFARRSKKKALLSLRYVYEDRWGGQLGYHRALRGSDSIYSESINTNRIEMIGTYHFPVREQIRFDYSYNYHLQDSYYGTTKYYADQHTLFGQAIWDKTWNLKLSSTTGLPVRYTLYDDNTPATTKSASETFLPGLFTQWEYKFNYRHTGMFGLRYDRNSLHGDIFTPRLSYKLTLSSKSVLRLTTGSGYRVVNVFTEDHASLTGSRSVVLKSNLQPEKTWNANINFSKHFVMDKGFASLDLTTFYTYFFNKIVPNYDIDPDLIVYDNIGGHAVSRGFSINTEYQHRCGFRSNIGATYLDVYRVEQGTKTPQQLTPRLSVKWAISYQLAKNLGSVDVTGDLKSPMHLPVVPNDFRPAQSPTFCLLGLQYTKKVRRMELYLGAKNILNFVPKHPLLRPFDPFDKHAEDPIKNPNGYTFDTTYNYAPIQGLKWYFGIRYGF